MDPRRLFKQPSAGFMAVAVCMLVVLSLPVAGYCGGQSPKARTVQPGLTPAALIKSKTPGVMVGRSTTVVPPQLHGTAPDVQGSESVAVPPWENIYRLTSIVHRLGRKRFDDARLAAYARALVIKKDALAEASPTQLAIIANALSVLMGTRYYQCAAVVLVKIAEQLSATPGLSQSCWNAIDLAMMASALNTQEASSVAGALKLIARAVVDWKGPLALKDEWTGQHLSMVANAIGKLKNDDDVFRALSRIAVEVNHRRGQLADWSAQSLGLMANALQGQPGEKFGRAVKVVAEEIYERGYELSEHHGWSAMLLSMLANAVANGHSVEVDFELLEVIAEEVVDRGQDLHNAALWPTLSLVLIAKGLGQALPAAGATEAIKAVAEAVALRAPALGQKHGWSAKGLSTVAMMLGRVEGARMRRSLRAIARELVVREQNQELSRGWSVQDLAMAANGISKVSGDEISRALEVVAKVVLSWGEAITHRDRWSLQGLAMLANAISKVPGKIVDEALVVLSKVMVNHCCDERSIQEWSPQGLVMMAGAVKSRAGPEGQQAMTRILDIVLQRWPKLHGRDGWNSQSLAMLGSCAGELGGEQLERVQRRMAQAVIRRERQLHDRQLWGPIDLAMVAATLHSGSGQAVTDALTLITQEVLDPDTDLSDDGQWSVRNLATMASAVSHGLCGIIADNTLNRIAEALVARGSELIEEDGWTARDLSVVAYAMSGTRGKAVSRLLNLIADAVLCWPALNTGRASDEWTFEMLNKLATALYPATSARAFETVINCLAAAESVPQDVMWLLSRMSNWHLLVVHLQGAEKLLDTLEAQNYRLTNRRALNELIWAITLMHFRSPADSSLAARFKHHYRHYRRQRHALPKLAMSKDAEPVWENWHDTFVRDYWRKTITRPVTKVESPPDSYRPSVQQKELYSILGRAFKDIPRQMETQVNRFPVDILLNNNLCIEVDGPHHFVPCDACSAGAPGCQVTKDSFIDHMLRRYQCEVVRIDYTIEPGSRAFQDKIKRIQSLLRQAHPVD